MAFTRIAAETIVTLLLTLSIFAFIIDTSKAVRQFIDTESQTIQNESFFVNRSGEVWLNVYQSIYGSQSSITSSSQDGVSCSAEHSCSGIKSIYLIAQHSKLYCRGKDACSCVELIHADDTGLYINLVGAGYRSFANSNIESNSGTISCLGQTSCRNAIIHSGNKLYASGAQSLMNSTIESTDDTSLYLSGYYAAYGATFHCNGGHICYINCESMTGCFMMYLICDGECKFSSPSANAMLPITTPAHLLQTVLLGESISINSNDTECSNRPWDEPDDKRVPHQDIVLSDLMSPMCCRGTRSCRFFNIFNSPDLPDVVLKCGGYGSCVNNVIGIVGDVHCTGSESCQNSDIPNATNTICSGLNSCHISRINSGATPSDFVYRSGFYPNPTGSINIWCNGQRACSSAKIHIERGYLLSLYLLGREAGFNVNVNCEGGSICDIYCYAGQSCRDMQLEGYGIFNVECDELSDCPIGYSYSLDPTLQPTIVPTTNEPTNVPTFNPTGNPFLERESKQDSGSPINDLVLTTSYSQGGELEQSDNISTIIILVATGSATFVCILAPK